MRKIVVLALVGSGISFALAIIARLMKTRLPLIPGGVQSATFLNLVNTFLLIAILFILLDLAKACKK